VFQFGDLCCLERLDTAILFLADCLRSISLTLTCLTLFTRDLILDDCFSFLRWACLYRAPGTVNPRVLLFALCAGHHTSSQSAAMYRCSFAHCTPALCLSLFPRNLQTLSSCTLQLSFPAVSLLCEFTAYSATGRPTYSYYSL